MKTIDKEKLDRVVAKARKYAETCGHGYREKAMKLYPHIYGRCCREFKRSNLHELTVCLYCHDNELQRYEEQLAEHRIVLSKVEQK